MLFCFAVCHAANAFSIDNLAQDTVCDTLFLFAQKPMGNNLLAGNTLHSLHENKDDAGAEFSAASAGFAFGNASEMAVKDGSKKTARSKSIKRILSISNYYKLKKTFLL